MNQLTRTDLYFKFLNYLYDCWQVNGEFKSLTSLAQSHGVNKTYTGPALQKMGIIEQVGKGVYKWKTTQNPSKHLAKLTWQMVSKLSSETSKKSLERKKASIPSRKLTSVDEIKNKAKSEARTQLIKASQAASVLGVNLLEMKENQIEEFISKLES